MAESKLTKALHTQMTRLKLLDAHSAPEKFSIDYSPFASIEDDECIKPINQDFITIIGRIFPVSEIYKESAFQIEIKLPSSYPAHAPTVNFKTKIYHPNVAEDGEFCHNLLKATVDWKAEKSLVDVVKAVVDRIDHPELECAIRPILATEYTNEREKFNRTALQMVTKHKLPRS